MSLICDATLLAFLDQHPPGKVGGPVETAKQTYLQVSWRICQFDMRAARNTVFLKMQRNYCVKYNTQARDEQGLYNQLYRVNVLFKPERQAEEHAYDNVTGVLCVDKEYNTVYVLFFRNDYYFIIYLTLARKGKSVFSISWSLLCHEADKK